MPNEFEPSALSSSLTTLWLPFKLVTFFACVAWCSAWSSSRFELCHSWGYASLRASAPLEFIKRHWASVPTVSVNSHLSVQLLPLMPSASWPDTQDNRLPLVSVSPHRLHLALFSHLPHISHVITVGSEDVTCCVTLGYLFPAEARQGHLTSVVIPILPLTSASLPKHEVLF